ncbi:hypothetical protein V494_08083 [Pseudogymnoascus sp. VKM F-4513 (FW-928)]|nr:hypothetical protein V494_08083 [Pseudogymnoascus sp. VKM F-4513 (FW-928)]
MAAAREGHAKVMRLLMEREDVDLQVRDWRGMSLLGAAAQYGHLEAVRLLLGWGGGVEVDVRDNTGKTPLLLAAWLKESDIVHWRREELEVVRLLLETEGVDVHARDEYGRGALAQAVGCRKGNLDMVALLLEGGVDVEARDKWGATPLLAAAEWGNTEVLTLLLERGADVHARNFDGMGALSLAARNRNHEVMALLLERGYADVNELDDNARRLLAVAMEAREPDSDDYESYHDIVDAE